jgi:hypothetical protein
MKYFFYTLCLLCLANSCTTNKEYLSRSDQDNTLFEAVKSINKNKKDSAALQALPQLYQQAQERNLRKINSYYTSNDLTKWNKILTAYQTLQSMYSVIVESDAASSRVSPKNYQQNIMEVKEEAAADYYNQATDLTEKGGRENARTAYGYFKKANTYVPNYKDATAKMEETFQNAIINVVVYPVQDNSYFINSGWGTFGYNFSNEYFQLRLIRELKGVNSNSYPARFYSDLEARQNNIKADWDINLILRNIFIPRPQISNYSRQVSRQIEAGRDSSGKIRYTTVYATLNISRRFFNAKASMEINITDFTTRKNIVLNTFNEEYRWNDEHATYSGDSRALSSTDWAIINNSRFDEPRREDVLNELYLKLYPQVKNKIIQAVDW